MLWANERVSIAVDEEARRGYALDQLQVVELLADERREQVEVLIYDRLDVSKGAHQHEAPWSTR